MLQQLKNLFGIGRPAVRFKELVANGAQIIDVRTKPEYRTGHIAGSVNIPLQELGASLSRISKDKPVITCCASGMRSASAKSILRSQGFAEVHKGGGWVGLQNKIS